MPECQQCGLPGATPTPSFPDGSLCRECAMGRVHDPQCPFYPGQLVRIDGLTQRLTVVHYIPATDTIEARTDHTGEWVNLTPLRDRVTA